MKILLQTIRAYSVPNILDFIEENESSYGIDMNLFLTTIESKSSILRLYFDGAWQRSKRAENPMGDENKLTLIQRNLWKYNL